MKNLGHNFGNSCKSIRKNLTTLLEHPEWFMEVVKGSKTVDEAETSHQDENLGKPQVDCLEHVVGHDRDVYMEDDQAVDIDEIFDASVLMEIVTSTEEEGATFGPIDDDYKGDDTTTSSATLALEGGAQDTIPSYAQDSTCVGIVGEDGVELSPMYEEEPSLVRMRG
jgi:hypothetical protein